MDKKEFEIISYIVDKSAKEEIELLHTDITEEERERLKIRSELYYELIGELSNQYGYFVFLKECLDTGCVEAYLDKWAKKYFGDDMGGNYGRD